jgi:hypothetical protein
MPPHFFFGHLRLDYTSAIRADTSKQNFSVAPRHWYIDASFRCDRCGEEFCFVAAEQKRWYEEYAFWVDSLPNECRGCRRELRRLKSLRQAYDREIAIALSSKDVEPKIHVATIVDLLLEAGENLPTKIRANRTVLGMQIARTIGPNPA